MSNRQQPLSAPHQITTAAKKATGEEQCLSFPPIDGPSLPGATISISQGLQFCFLLRVFAIGSLMRPRGETYQNWPNGMTRWTRRQAIRSRDIEKATSSYIEATSSESSQNGLGNAFRLQDVVCTFELSSLRPLVLPILRLPCLP